jgi:type II secretory pathway pseudopilin PulG
MSLIEVMVSLTMLGVVLVMLGQGLTLGIKLNTESKNQVTNLGVCKRVTENLKGQIQAAPEAFDGATDNGSNYYAIFNRPANNPVLFDSDGVEIPAGGDKSGAAFQVTTSVDVWRDNAGNVLTDTAGNTLVKVLSVRVATYPGDMLAANENGVASPRETTMKVELTRPSA